MILPWAARVDGLDARALAWVTSRRPAPLLVLMRVVTHTADTPVAAGLLGLGLGLWPRLATLATVVAAGSAIVTAHFLKLACRRVRPRDRAVGRVPDRFSMPSGHATAAWTIAAATCLLAPAFAALACAWATVISLSRLVLGMHYPSDILAGALLGAASAGAWLAVAAHFAGR
ncbi:MAG TPA: phosphatase PAP2 family protein [Polyangia bacterium]